MSHRQSLFFGALLCALPCVAGALEPNDVPGTYHLQGVHEMAGELSLSAAAGHPYLAQFSYGAADWAETGTWKLDGETLVLSGGRFKQRNTPDAPLLLPSGTRFALSTGKLTATDAERPLTFVDADKTPPSGQPGVAGEGRMAVKGTVVKLDSDTMVVKVNNECIDFSVDALSPALRKLAKKGAALDTEIPYDAIVGGESCPTD